MSDYYKPKKTRGLFEPDSDKPFVVSRSGIDLFTECPRCFYFDKRLGVGRPPGYPFSLNSAVDTLLKNEFDVHRAKGEPHPLMKTYKIDAVPYAHEKIEEWRDARTRGIGYLHEPTNLFVRGGIDDVWVNPKGELIVVDYKATSKTTKISIDAEWQAGYKRQMEVYQWLFRRNGFRVSNTAYFVYVNGRQDKKAFDGRLEFDITLIPYVGDDSWIEPTLAQIKECLMSEAVPKPGRDCGHCPYREAAGRALLARMEKTPVRKEEKKSAGHANQKLF